MIRSSTVKMLFIAWNKIRDKGGVLLFEALATNVHIKVFDGSFNSFNSNTQRKWIKPNKKLQRKVDETENCCKSAIALSKMFQENSTLIHMDLSHNNFSVEDCEIISKGLNQNRSVLGLHMSGNQIDTNALGFIQKISNYDPGHAHIHTRIPESLETGVLCEKKRTFNATSN